MMPAWWKEEHLILCTLAGPSFPASKDASWPRGAPWDHCSVMVVDHSISAGFEGTVLSSCPSHMDVAGLGRIGALCLGYVLASFALGQQSLTLVALAEKPLPAVLNFAVQDS